MTDALPLSSRIYSRLLVLYPEDLRREFGAEMALVFAEDLDAARQEAGILGVIRVWRCALGEFFRFALPGYVSSPAVRVPAICCAVFMAMMSGNMALALRQSPHTATLFQSAFIALWLPMFTTPFIALVAVWTCRGRGVTSLHLSHDDQGH